MQSRFDAAEAEKYRAQYSRWGADLADRVYTSRLLGQDPSLVLHGGGNTSVKSRSPEVDGQLVDVLWVKGSGWDLGSIEPRGFSQCRLAPLRNYCRLPSLSDEGMVAALRSQMLDPGGPAPSVEALLHAHLPGKFVDHTHADAVLAIVDQPDAARRVAELWGERALFLPYVMPGFVLAQRILELGIGEGSPALLVLEKHGIFSWGQSARESYERMIDAVGEAERYVQQKSASTAVVPATIASAEGLRAAQLAVAPVLRGALSRRDGGARFMLDFRSGPEVLAFLASEAAPLVAARGCVTPDHSIRTKPFPAWIELGAPAGSLSQDELQQRVDAGLDRFARQYDAYFEAQRERSPVPLTRLDLLPRIVAIPGLGVVGLGKTCAQAAIAGDLYEHAVGVMTRAERIGTYQPVSHADLFDVEYWSLEQAKLGAKRSEAGLAAQIAVVTGAASGIGLQTAAHFLSLGAHVVLVDRDSAALEQRSLELTRKHGGAVRSVVADLTQPDAARAALETAVLAFGGIDIVVSNAGTAPSGALHESEGTELLARSLEVNLMSHQHVARAAASILVRQGTGGCLLFNASKSAFNPGPLFGPYAVAKSALVALMKQYAIDLAPFGIRANAVNADRVRTGLFSEALIESRAKARGTTADGYFKANLLGRETLASDVAQAFGYLATASATTGTVLPVDGGNASAFPR
jgi:rhamnose utilization protein RhaD (predicted bifunctional aldolase and dehydrogenase)/NAD(P)-dependent dehydrogenase (short-subunit alcohol dehydrogenase family)